VTTAVVAGVGTATIIAVVVWALLAQSPGSVAEGVLDKAAEENVEDDSSSGRRVSGGDTTAKVTDDETILDDSDNAEGEVSEEEKERLENAIKTLKQQKTALEADIDALTARLKELRKWQTASFALTSHSGQAVAIRDDGESLHVISRLDSQDARLAKAVLRKARIYQLDRDDNLTRRLYSAASPGMELPAGLKEEIFKYWKHYRFYDSPITEDTVSVAYYDWELNRRVIGVHRGFESESLLVDLPSKGLQTVEKRRIQEGSLRIAPSDRLLTTVSNTDFLDYCIACIAQTLQSCHSEGNMQRRTFLSTAVHCEVDIPRETLRHYRLLDSMLAKRAGDRLVTFTKRSGGYAQSSLSGGGFTDLWSIQGGSDAQWYDNQDFTDKPVYEDVLRKRESLYEQHMEPELQKLAEYVEDILHQKLYEAGVPTVETEPLAASRFASDNSDPVQMAFEKNATHLVRVQLNRTHAQGQYFLAVRLTDTRTRQNLWSGSGDRAWDTSLIGEQLHIDIGRLAIVEQPEDAKSSLSSVESPAVVSPGRVVGPLAGKHLVYLESGVESETPVEFRTLFSEYKQSIAASEVNAVGWVDSPQDVPSHLLLRYCAARLISHATPPAGRVIDVDGSEATALIGRMHGVSAGDQLLVLRVRQSDRDGLPLSSRLHGKNESRTLLCQEVVVAEAFEEHCRIYLSENGAEEWYPENATLRPNDLVLQRPEGTTVVAILAPDFSAVTSSTAGRKLFRNAPRAVTQKLINDVSQTGNEIARLIRNAMVSQQVRILFVDSSETARRSGCSHLVSTSLTFDDSMTSSGNPIYIVGFAIRALDGKGAYQDQFNIRIRPRDLPAI